jgi:hypothetical protein
LVVQKAMRADEILVSSPQVHRSLFSAILDVKISQSGEKTYLKVECKTIIVYQDNLFNHESTIARILVS